MTLKIQNKDGHTVAVLKDDASEPTFVGKLVNEGPCVCKKTGEECECNQEKENQNDIDECSS